MNVRDDVGSKGRHFSFKMDEKVHVSVTKCLIFYAHNFMLVRYLVSSSELEAVDQRRDENNEFQYGTMHPLVP